LHCCKEWAYPALLPRFFATSILSSVAPLSSNGLVKLKVIKKGKLMPSEDSKQEMLQSNPSPDASAYEHSTQQGKDVVSHTSPLTLFTEEGRLALYAYWVERRFGDGRLEQSKSSTPQEKVELFADWLRTLVADGKLDSRTRLPAYQVFAGKPFYLKKKYVAQAMRPSIEIIDLNTWLRSGRAQR